MLDPKRVSFTCCALLLAAFMLFLPLVATGVSTEYDEIYKEDPPSLQLNHLPMAEDDARRYTPRQYLWLMYPKYARVMDRIIWCESRWYPDAENNNSTASGLAQFLDGTWVSTRRIMGRSGSLRLKLDPYEHIDTAIVLYKSQGAWPWLASNKCHKLLPYEFNYAE